MILEIAGAKPLAASTLCGAKPAVLNLPAEKEGRAVPKNLEISVYGGTGKNLSSYGSQKDAYSNGKEAAVGLGEGMWKGVFGSTA